VTITEAVTRCTYATLHAEGYHVPGSIPARACNPGDLKLGDHGLGTINAKTIYPSHSAGFAALEHEWTLILTGHSAYYHPDWTPRKIAAEWTGNDNPSGWLKTFCELVPITPDAPLSSLLAEQTT
jgi:hypothetical protein